MQPDTDRIMKKVLRSSIALIILATLVAAPALHAQDGSERARFDDLARTAAQQFAAARADASPEAEQTRSTTPPPAPGTVIVSILSHSLWSRPIKSRPLGLILACAVDR